VISLVSAPSKPEVGTNRAHFFLESERPDCAALDATDRRSRVGSVRIASHDPDPARYQESAVYRVGAPVPGGRKRAWIQRRDGDRDWARTPQGRYLNIVRVDEAPAGSPADFPIFSELPDEQILEAFVAAVCAVTGCRIP